MLKLFTAAGFAATALISSSFSVVCATDANAYGPVQGALAHAQYMEHRHAQSYEVQVAANRTRRVIRTRRARRNGSAFSGKAQGKESLNARSLNGANPNVVTSDTDKRRNVAITGGDGLETFATHRVRVKDGRFFLEH